MVWRYHLDSCQQGADIWGEWEEPITTNDRPYGFSAENTSAFNEVAMVHNKNQELAWPFLKQNTSSNHISKNHCQLELSIKCVVY